MRSSSDCYDDVGNGYVWYTLLMKSEERNAPRLLIQRYFDVCTKAKLVNLNTANAIVIGGF